ncbi:MAG: murein peptide amidase A [Bdellovibrionaceae bacterium]|nr:murein peptide amidase A [Pseudobdellovibrionaceae bacterium]
MQNNYSIGRTTNGLPIMACDFGLKGKPILLLAGVHGDEIEGVSLAKTLIADFIKSFNYNVQLTVIAEFNLDGILLETRKNANAVDLNRNLPTTDWTSKEEKEKYFPGTSPCSEVENKNLVQFITEKKIEFIISLHSWKPCLNINGNCKKEATILSQITDYKIVEDIGYPTPGCLGTYAGLERDIPTITYELPRLEKNRRKVEDKNILAIKKVLSL